VRKALHSALIAGLERLESNEHNLRCIADVATVNDEAFS
jgi:hypothetical protein